MTSTSHGTTRSFQLLVIAAVLVFAAGAAFGALVYWLGSPMRLDPAGARHLGFWEILRANTGVVVTMAAGVLTVGLVTVSVLFFNGMILGAAVSAVAAAGQAHQFWSGVAPHFVPEVAAFVLAAAADLRLAWLLARWIRYGEQPGFRAIVRIWALPHGVVAALLVAAALIEAYISGVR